MGDACPYCGIHIEPNTLKEALEFCNSLSMCSSSQVEATGGFYHQIKKDASNYYNCEHEFGMSEGPIACVVQKCHEILTKLVGKDMCNGKNVRKEVSLFDCVAHCASTFEMLVPHLFGTLYFLYFMCNRNEFGTFGGGSWDSANTVASNENLREWLTDECVLLITPKQKTAKRGFKKAELSEKHNVESLVNIDYGSDWPIGPIYDGYLQRLMVPMIFLKEWHRGKTAHTLLFLKRYIHLLHYGNTEEASGIPNVTDFLTACNSCYVTMQVLFEKLYPVCKENTQLYLDALRQDNRALLLYYQWLKENTASLIASLREMKIDCQQWNQDNLKRGKSYGPFPWGFVFTNTDWVSGENDKILMSLINALIQRLDCLKDVMTMKALSATGGEEHGSADAPTPPQPTTNSSASESESSKYACLPKAPAVGGGESQSEPVVAHLSKTEGASTAESTSSNATKIATGVTAAVAAAASIIGIQQILHL